jgi:hypothetical protein
VATVELTKPVRPRITYNIPTLMNRFESSESIVVADSELGKNLTSGSGLSVIRPEVE